MTRLMTSSNPQPLVPQQFPGTMQTDKRIVVYPTYINKKRTQAEGRRISVDKGCDDPLATEIFDVCKFLQLPCQLELDKSYSREWWTQGRVRVQLKKDSGDPVDVEIPTRKALYLKIAQLVPRHPNRQPKPKEKEQKPAQSSSKSGKQGKKGGKKGKR